MGAPSDLDYLRLPYETRDQWQLRELFLRKHWSDEDDEDRLVSLSQIFINIEFMGCSYNDDLMQRVAEMSAGLTDDYHEQRRSVVHRTFGMSADEFKKQKGPEPPAKKKRRSARESLGTKIVDNDAKKEQKADEKASEVFDRAQSSQSDGQHALLPKLQTVVAQMTLADKSLGALTLLNKLCTAAKIGWKYELVSSAPCFVARVLLDGVLLCEVLATKKSSAKLVACEAAVQSLQAKHFDVRPFKSGAAATTAASSAAAVFGSDDRRSWSDPQSHFFDHIRSVLDQVSERVQANSAESDPINKVSAAFANAGLEVDVVQLPQPGWSRELQAAVAGVRLACVQLKGAKQLAKQAEPANRKQLFAAVAEALSAKHYSIEPLEATGGLEEASVAYQLRTSDQPIDDKHTNSHETSGSLAAAQPETRAKAGLSKSCSQPTPPAQLDHYLHTSVILYKCLPRTHESALSVLNTSIQKCGIREALAEEVVFDNALGKHSLHLRLGERVFAAVPLESDSVAQRKQARAVAAVRALEHLSRHCFAIGCKFGSADGGEGEEVDPNAAVDNQSPNGAASSHVPVQATEPGNVGHRLMQKMGYTGGGLGSGGQGIEQPILVEELYKRHGLGYVKPECCPRQFRQAIHTVLNDFISTAKPDQTLIFSANVSKEQRSTIHQLCAKFSLQSKSFGSGEQRQITVQRKLKPADLLGILLRENGETERYVLYAPGTFEFNFTEQVYEN